MPQLVERLAEVRLRRSWAAIVGPDVARRTHPGLFAEGCLTIVVDNSPWLHELTLRQAGILALIRREHTSVRTLRLVIGPLPTEMGDDVAASRPARPLTEHDRLEIEEATAIISDAALAAAARSLLTRARQASRAPALPQ